jgi:hypothetical protein
MANTYINGNLPNSSTITITSGGTSSSGSVLTATGAVPSFTGASGTSYTTTWASPNTNFTSSNGKTVMTMPYGEDKIVLEKSATLEVKGNVVINGIDLEERLKTIEKVLMIPERDAIMETKYPSLKKKYDEYIKALAKYRTWEAIKGEDND